MVSFDFVLRIIGERGAVGDIAVTAAGTGYERQGIDQAGLTAAAVPDKGHVSDVFGIVDLH